MSGKTVLEYIREKRMIELLEIEGYESIDEAIGDSWALAVKDYAYDRAALLLDLEEVEDEDVRAALLLDLKELEDEDVRAAFLSNLGAVKDEDVRAVLKKIKTLELLFKK